MAGAWWIGESDLDQYQKGVISLAAEGNHLVLGPPGSGKTNVLLLRANYLTLSQKPNIAIVVFTKTLRKYIASGGKEYDFDLEKIMTCNKWQRDVLYQYGISVNPLARRIIRDLTIPDRLVDRPRCDIALEELRMHASPESILKMTSKAGRLDIDILPGVTTSVRWPPHEVPEEPDMKRHRDVEARHLLMEMDDYAMRHRHLMERLREVLRLGESEQPPAKKKRGGKS